MGQKRCWGGIRPKTSGVNVSGMETQVSWKVTRSSLCHTFQDNTLSHTRQNTASLCKGCLSTRIAFWSGSGERHARIVTLILTNSKQCSILRRGFKSILNIKNAEHTTVHPAANLVRPVPSYLKWCRGLQKESSYKIILTNSGFHLKRRQL